jgi:hypothetical protein
MRLMMAAPALVPATTPPPSNTSRMALSISVGWPPGCSVSTMSSCAPPEKNTARDALTCAISAGSARLAARSAPASRGATGMTSARAPRRFSAAAICAPQRAGLAAAVANTAMRAPAPPASSTMRCQTASLSVFSAPPMTMAVPACVALAASKAASRAASKGGFTHFMQPCCQWACAAATGLGPAAVRRAPRTQLHVASTQALWRSRPTRLQGSDAHLRASDRRAQTP